MDLMDWAMNQGLGAVIALIFIFQLNTRLGNIEVALQRLADGLSKPPGAGSGG